MRLKYITESEVISMDLAYYLPIDVIKHICNVVSMKIFGKPLIKVGKIIDLRLYDQNEIIRCKNDLEVFMQRAKDKGRTVSIV